MDVPSARKSWVRSLPIISNVILSVLLFSALAKLLYENYELPSLNPQQFYEDHSTHSYSLDVADAVHDTPATRPSPPPVRPPNGLPKLDWSAINNLVFFGDSLSDTGFNARAEQPSPAFPWGNPPLWQGRFLGPTWTDFLTMTYNESVLLNFDMAKGGATIDNKLQPSPYGSPSFVDQTNLFLKVYKDNFSNGTFTANNTIAMIRFGVNDIVGSWGLRPGTFDLSKESDRFWEQLERLYEVGLRKFVFLNVGPVDFNYIASGHKYLATVPLTQHIYAWNDKLVAVKHDFHREHADVDAWHFDLHYFFLWLQHNSAELEPTRSLKNTTGICPVYAGANEKPFVRPGDEPWKMNHPSCNGTLSEYFWSNEFHPTYTVHNATAMMLVKECFGTDQENRFCT